MFCKDNVIDFYSVLLKYKLDSLFEKFGFQNLPVTEYAHVTPYKGRQQH